MPYVPIQAISRAESARYWPSSAGSVIREAGPDLAPALDLQRELLSRVIDLAATLDGGRLPRLSLPPKYLAAKLARGVPALAGEPIPLPVAGADAGAAAAVRRAGRGRRRRGGRRTSAQAIESGSSKPGRC